MNATMALPKPLVSKRAIQRHYDLATPFYRLLWGPHIHHGLWESDESPAVAQQQLMDRLAQAADIGGDDNVLDVGCGMGGSSLFLARERNCQVTGVTLSPVQRAWASLAARWQGMSTRARFLCRDIEGADFAPSSFDVVWSIECTEHLFDKPSFIERAAHWLRPNGRVAICVWLAGDRPQSPEAVALVQRVCEGFLCPSLGTMDDYLGWMRDAGLEPTCSADLTAQVTRTWEICLERVRRSRVHWLARCAGRDMTGFLDHFGTILNAYATGAMRYGCLVARKPA